MLIDQALIDKLLAQAEGHPRKRAYYDLRNSAEDDSQRMLVAVLPSDAEEVIHRHRDSSESLAILTGSVTEIFFDDQGREIERYELNASKGHYGLHVPVGVFHTLIANEPSVFMESKAGRYESVKEEDRLLRRSEN